MGCSHFSDKIYQYTPTWKCFIKVCRDLDDCISTINLNYNKFHMKSLGFSPLGGCEFNTLGYMCHTLKACSDTILAVERAVLSNLKLVFKV